jgi:hypothetical protein
MGSKSQASEEVIEFLAREAYLNLGLNKLNDDNNNNNKVKQSV